MSLALLMQLNHDNPLIKLFVDWQPPAITNAVFIPSYVLSCLGLLLLVIGTRPPRVSLSHTLTLFIFTVAALSIISATFIIVFSASLVHAVYCGMSAAAGTVFALYKKDGRVWPAVLIGIIFYFGVMALIGAALGLCL